MAILPAPMTAAPAVLAALVVLLAGAAVRPSRRRLVRPREGTVPASRSRRRRAGLLVGALSCGTVLVGPIVVPASAVAAAAIIGSRPMRRSRARLRAIERDFPDMLELLVVCIRSGLTPRHAVAAASAAPGPCGDALGDVIHRCERGTPFADAVVALAEQLGTRAVAVADSIASCERYGLPLEPLLVQLAAEARAARHRLAQADARRLPVRLSFPLVACTLPSFVLLAIVPAVIAALSSLGTTPW